MNADNLGEFLEYMRRDFPAALPAASWFSREFRKSRVSSRDFDALPAILTIIAQFKDLDALTYAEARARVASNKWVYLDGQVEFNGEPHMLLRALADRIGAPDVKAIANSWYSGQGTPHGYAHALAHGEILPTGHVIIYNSNADRNSVRDAVESAHHKTSDWKTAAADLDGVMVALDVPAGIGQSMAVKGGEPVSNLHITIAYLDQGMQDENAVKRIVSEVARTFGPVTAYVDKLEEFPESKDGDIPVVAIMDGPDLTRLHEAVKAGLKGHGESISERYDFTPHITLEYIKPGGTFQGKDPTGISITFQSLNLHNGGSVTQFPFAAGGEDDAWKIEQQPTVAFSRVYGWDIDGV